MESEEGTPVAAVGVGVMQGAIPKRRVEVGEQPGVSGLADVIIGKKMPESKTYFCLKSILKQNRRRYTLVTTEEFRNLVAGEKREEEEVFSRENYFSKRGVLSREVRRENPNR